MVVEDIGMCSLPVEAFLDISVGCGHTHLWLPEQRTRWTGHGLTVNTSCRGRHVVVGALGHVDDLTLTGHSFRLLKCQIT